MAKATKKKNPAPAAAPAAVKDIVLTRDWFDGRKKGDRLATVSLEADVHFAFVAHAVQQMIARSEQKGARVTVVLNCDHQVGDTQRKAGELLCTVELVEGVIFVHLCQWYLDSIAVIPKPAEK